MRVYSVGELKKILAEIPDDTKVVAWQQDMERCGCRPGASFSLDKRSPVERRTYDRFDYTDYTYTVYEQDEKNGELVLTIG